MKCNNNLNTKLYLKVKPCEENEVKKLGAKFDNLKKEWYVAGIDFNESKKYFNRFDSESPIMCLNEEYIENIKIYRIKLNKELRIFVTLT